jgi:N-hydroxyarylamine O-acetyltransferase
VEIGQWRSRAVWYHAAVHASLVDSVLGRMGVPRPDPDLAGLRSVYAAWCGAVPFDNTLKLIHTSEGRDGSLPGSTAEAFFGDWLERGTGGTCWAGNGALHDLLSALGFEVHRAFATMLPRPDVVGPNHGSVVVTIDGARWIADASILSGEPIAIRPEGEEDASEPLPRLSWRGAKPAVVWRMLMAPDGFPCRIERIGADAEEWDALHQRTVAWSPFNYQLSARLLRGHASIGAASGQRFRFEPDGSLEASPLTAGERVRFLVEEIGIAEEVALRVPPDRPVPPRP